MRQFVFAYGSLVRRARCARWNRRARWNWLEGARRTWDVAMDNRLDLPHYKYYVDPRTGARPAVFVTFLDLRDAPGDAVSGLLLEVDDDELRRLDLRERSYRRVEVSAQLRERVDGIVWTYRGSQEARARFEEGRRSGRAVIRRAYLDAVSAAFRRGGPDRYRAFRRDTDVPPVPVVDLERIRTA